MKSFECPYYDECGLCCDQTNESCRIKELFEDFYKVEKLYVDTKRKLDLQTKGLEKIEQIVKTHDSLPCGKMDCELNKLCFDEVTNHGRHCFLRGNQLILQLIEKIK